jgi:hypothetical protein
MSNVKIMDGEDLCKRLLIFKFNYSKLSVIVKSCNKCSKKHGLTNKLEIKTKSNKITKTFMSMIILKINVLLVYSFYES